MLMAQSIKPLELTRTLAYHRRYPYLTAVTLGEGSIDLAENIPSKDYVLLAAAAALVARDDISPDITRLVLSEAESVHGNGGLLEEQGEFPSTHLVEIPMAEDARRYLEEGPTGLERYLPYWLASRLEWFIFVILPLLVLAYPLFRSMPILYDNAIRFQLYRWYIEARKVEQQLPSYSLDEVDQKIGWIDNLHEYLTKRVRVPVFYLAEYYELRSHLGIVSQRLEKRREHLIKRAEQSTLEAYKPEEDGPSATILAESAINDEAPANPEIVADGTNARSHTEGGAE
jgi:hypothetical protein